jgi:large subunit ribosomal protein L23
MTAIFNKKKEKKVETVVTTEKSKQSKSVQGANSNAYRVLIRPVVSEKASIAESMNVYSFRVEKSTDKETIKRAVKAVYGVMPTKVRIVNVEGKAVRGRSGMTRRGDWKKALVTLPKGQSIGIHEGV